jgi:hypothetical protein
MRRTPYLAVALLAAACASTSAPTAHAPQKEAGATDQASVGTPLPGETVSTYDLNHDGKPDLWKYTAKDANGKEILTRKEKDLNGDGKIDAWEYYGPDGALQRLVYDLDFDGKPDVTLYFEKDQLVRKEYALGFDGAPHAWNYYEKNKLVRKERDTRGNGKVDTWEYWENGEIDRIGIDLDGDGLVDKWETRRTAAPGAPAPGAQPEDAVTK